MKLFLTLFPSCTFTFRFYHIHNTGHSAKEESMQVGYMVSQGNRRKTIENRASRKHNKNQVDAKKNPNFLTQFNTKIFNVFSLTDLIQNILSFNDFVCSKV